MADGLALYSSGSLPGPSHLVSDQRLTRLAKKGDRRAFSAIYRRYHQELFRYCQAILGDPHEAEDALQATMVKVLAALPGETREIRLRPWLYRIAHNEAIEVVRRRRPASPVDEDALAAPGPEETAEGRERLRALINDLRELPERQRGAVVMRELGGMSFEEIGSAFATSAAVARQTVYEARVGLQQMKAGREMSCADVRRKISDGDGRVIRRREVRAHLRGCQACRDFRSAIATRKHDLAALAPLPAVASAGLLQGVLGGIGQGSAGSGVLAAAGGGAAAKGLSASIALKSAAAVTAVTVAGVSAAQIGGVVHLPRPGEGAEPSRTQAAPAGAGESSGEAAGAAVGLDASEAHAPSDAAEGPGARGAGREAGVRDAVTGTDRNPVRGAAGENAAPGAKPSDHSLPAAASHGQETAASHGGGRENAPGQAHAHSHGATGSKPAHPTHPEHPAHPAKPVHPPKPARPPKPAHPAAGGSANSGKDTAGASGKKLQQRGSSS
jgi:RNA polymerase sigma factor (sigma-70 family)